MTVCALPWDASLNGRGVGDWNPGRPMATPAETVDAYCVDWCKARCEALGADAKDAWRPEARLPSFHTIATNSRWRLPSGGPTAIPRRRCIRPEPDPSLIIPLSSHRSTTRRRRCPMGPASTICSASSAWGHGATHSSRAPESARQIRLERGLFRTIFLRRCCNRPRLKLVKLFACWD